MTAADDTTAEQTTQRVGADEARHRMPTVERLVRASPEAVFEVLSDGWSYAAWVVGTARIRAVSDDWPAAGARLHHSVGLWPLLLSDDTQVLDCVPGRRLVLRARLRPLGEADVTIELEPVAEGTRLTFAEDLTSPGARSLVPGFVRDALVTRRNAESARRLALLAERATHD
jgi:uncharacterized protein YndB with AHSA1/START domain